MINIAARKCSWGAVFLAISLLGVRAGADPSQSNAVPRPAVTGPRFVEPLETIRTLKPTLEWAPQDKPGVSYDLIICLGITNNDGLWIPGKAAYYREGIPTTNATIDRPLRPNTVYVWSVRSRLEKKTSKWSAYNDANPGLFPRSQLRYDIFWPFKTPGK
jgi:hypothetical protein